MAPKSLKHFRYKMEDREHVGHFCITWESSLTPMYAARVLVLTRNLAKCPVHGRTVVVTLPGSGLGKVDQNFRAFGGPSPCS